MKKTYSIFLLSIFLLCILSSCVNATVEPAPCVGFREYLNGHQFSNPWDHIGFKFTGTTSLTVVGVNGINGLKIDNTGLRVELPGVTEDVTIQAMAFGNEPIIVQALDGSKNHVDEELVPDDEALHIIHLSADEISTVIFTEGDNEAFLVEICMGEFYTN